MVAAPSKQGLLAAAQMQDAVGKDVPALEIAGQLHLVYRDEGGVGLARHRLDGADGIFRARPAVIFSSPVTSATLFAPTFSQTRP